MVPISLVGLVGLEAELRSVPQFVTKYDNKVEVRMKSTRQIQFFDISSDRGKPTL